MWITNVLELPIHLPDVPIDVDVAVAVAVVGVAAVVEKLLPSLCPSRSTMGSSC